MISCRHETVLYMTLRVLKDGLTAEMLQGEIERAEPAYSMVMMDRDTIPLTEHENEYYDDDDEIPEDEHENDIELPALTSQKD